MSFFLIIWRFALGHAWLCAFNETQRDSISNRNNDIRQR